MKYFQCFCNDIFNTGRSLRFHKRRYHSIHSTLSLGKTVNYKNNYLHIYKSKTNSIYFHIDNIKSIIPYKDKEFKRVDKEEVFKNKYITYEGLYSLISSINTEETQDLKSWIKYTVNQYRENCKKNLFKEQLKLQVPAKKGYVYILSTDIEGVYKCGKTKNTVKKRVKSLQTGNVKNIEILYEYQSSDENILERLVHNILSNYRSNTNREHFCCSLNYMKSIVKLNGELLDKMKQTNEYVTEEEIKKKCQTVFI